MSVERNKEEQALDRLLGGERQRQPRGFTVPPDYFATFTEQVVERLSDEPPVERHVEMTRWQRVKPYVYLAAMFCGIWLMMNVFHRVAGGGQINLDNPPAQIAQIINEEQPKETYELVPSMIADMQAEYDVASAYDNMREFETDFNAIEDDVADEDILY